MKTEQRDTGLEDGSDVTTSQGMVAATQSRTRQGTEFSSRAWKIVLTTPWFGPSHTDFKLLASRTVRRYIFVVEGTQAVVLCYGSRSKLIHPLMYPILPHLQTIPDLDHGQNRDLEQ